jgi:hypothetical protein
LTDNYTRQDNYTRPDEGTRLDGHTRDFFEVRDDRDAHAKSTTISQCDEIWARGVENHVISYPHVVADPNSTKPVKRNTKTSCARKSSGQLLTEPVEQTANGVFLHEPERDT